MTRITQFLLFQDRPTDEGECVVQQRTGRKKRI